MAFLLPIISGISGAIGIGRSLFGGGGGAAAPQEAPITVTLEPPTDPRAWWLSPALHDPRTGTVTPVAEVDGGFVDTTLGGAPFVGSGGVADAQPVPDGVGSPSPLDTPLQQGITTYDPSLYPGISAAVPATPAMDVTGVAGGAINLPALISGVGNLVQEIRGAVGGLTVGGAVTRAIPAIEKVVPAWLGRVGGGAAAATAIYQLYRQLRASGASHQSAKRSALAAAGLRTRRRRMRPTNVRALRRAIRRVRSARRILSKVRGLHIGGRGGYSPRFRRRRLHRRGDLSPFLVEDQADMIDEAEDLGLSADGFQDYEEDGYGLE